MSRLNWKALQEKNCPACRKGLKDLNGLLHCSCGFNIRTSKANEILKNFRAGNTFGTGMTANEFELNQL